MTGLGSAGSKEVRACPTTPPAGPDRIARRPENLLYVSSHSMTNNDTVQKVMGDSLFEIHQSTIALHKLASSIL